MRTARSSAAIAPPESAGHASGSERATTAKRNDLRLRSTRPKWRPRTEEAIHEASGPRPRLSRGDRHRRHRLGVPLSAAVGRAQSRTAAQLRRQGGAGGPPGGAQPALAPRAGGILTEGYRGQGTEAEQGAAEHADLAGRARLDGAEILGDL